MNEVLGDFQIGDAVVITKQIINELTNVVYADVGDAGVIDGISGLDMWTVRFDHQNGHLPTSLRLNVYPSEIDRIDKIRLSLSIEVIETLL